MLGQVAVKIINLMHVRIGEDRANALGREHLHEHEMLATDQLGTAHKRLRQHRVIKVIMKTRRARRRRRSRI